MGVKKVCCPEFNVGMTFIGNMQEDEVVNVANVKRFTEYTGYLNSFKVTTSTTIIYLQLETHCYVLYTTLMVTGTSVSNNRRRS